jgi:phenol 2-monooxygenase
LRSIKQQLANTFYAQDGILLAGDASHSHSSGAAQGMNTGIHDAINLSWKLGGVVKGWYSPTILQTYSDERRAAAEHLIKLDKTFSTLISGDIPERYLGSNASSNELLTEVLEQSMGFNIGLGIRYMPNVLNKEPSTTMIVCGSRGPDVLLHKPGSHLTTRLFDITKNKGKWWLLVFAGNPTETTQGLQKCRAFFDHKLSCKSEFLSAMVNYLTIINGNSGQGEVKLGIPRFGNIYYDYDSSAHIKYGLSPEAGGVVILRPDGMLGFATDLHQVDELDSYFQGIIEK